MRPPTCIKSILTQKHLADGIDFITNPSRLVSYLASHKNPLISDLRIPIIESRELRENGGYNGASKEYLMFDIKITAEELKEVEGLSEEGVTMLQKAWEEILWILVMSGLGMGRRGRDCILW